MARTLRILSYALRQPLALLAMLGLTVATAAVTALTPWPIKLLVDYALGDSTTPAAIQSLLETLSLSSKPVTLIVLAAVASLAIFLLTSVLNFFHALTASAAGQRMIFDLAADLFHRLQRLSLAFHSRHPVGDSLSRLSGDTSCVYGVIDGFLFTPTQHLLTLTTVVGVAWSLDAQMALLALVVAPILVGSARLFGSQIKSRSKQSRQARSRLLSFVHQTLAAMPVVQTFGTERQNTDQFQRLADDAVVTSQRGRLVKNNFRFVNGLTLVTGTAVVLFVGGQRVLSGAISLGSLLVFLTYLRTMQGSFKALLGTYGKLKTVEASVDRIVEILDSHDEVKDAPDARTFPVPRPRKRGRVRIERVTFGYRPNRPVLKEVTLEAEPGETVAVVGRTGAGKSTLVSLIPRFFDPWEGRVTFEGPDVKELQLASLRAEISFVLQEPFLLPMSVAENIAYGKPGASRSEVVAAAVAARADGFIQELPEGYDTVLGEKGASLSEGEKQRLAIARALLKDAPVLILDEPSSALDAQTEALLVEALERVTSGRTTFVIAHRLSTIRRADRIVVLDDGRVVESGTHEELLSEHGQYWRLHSLQSPDWSEAMS